MLRSSFNLCRSLTKVKNAFVSKNSLPILSSAHNCTIISNKYCSSDKVGNSAIQNEVVYTGLLKKQVKLVKLFSLSSSLMGVCIQPIIYQKCIELNNVYIYGTGVFIGFFTFVTPLLLHLITKKYVTDIEYNPVTKIYTATLYTLFMRKKKIEFTPDDVEVPDIPGMFTSFHIKNIPVFIELSHFKDPNHYAKIMGYDKPIDFQIKNINTIETPEESKKM